MRNSKSIIPLSIVFLFLIFTTLMPVASANVPSILLGTTPGTYGHHTILQIEVTHSSPTLMHYVDNLQVTVENTTGRITYTIVPPAPPQTIIFNVTFDLGYVAERTNVSVIAHCNVDGFGADTYIELDPIILLWEQIESLQHQLDETESDLSNLSSSMDQLDQLSAGLDELQDALEALQNDLDSIRDELNSSAEEIKNIGSQSIVFAGGLLAAFIVVAIVALMTMMNRSALSFVGTSLHDVKKKMSDQEFIDFVIANINQFDKEIEEINKKKAEVEKAGKTWPSTATERGLQMRQEVLAAKKIELETAKGCAEEGQIDAAKDIADKALADFAVLEIGATLVAYAADLLGYTDIPLPGLGNILNVLKKLFGNKKVLKAVEIAEKALKAYETAKSDVEKVEKLKELTEKVQEVKKALGE